MLTVFVSLTLRFVKLKRNVMYAFEHKKTAEIVVRHPFSTSAHGRAVLEGQLRNNHRGSETAGICFPFDFEYDSFDIEHFHTL